MSTWSPSDKGANVTLSGGNLVATLSGTDSVRSTNARSTGDQSYSTTINSVTAPQAPMVGFGTAGAQIDQYPGFDTLGWGYYTDGTKYTNNVSAAYGAAYTAGDVIRARWNAASGEIEFFKNGVSQGVAFSGLSGTYFAMLGCGSSSTTDFLQCTSDFSLWPDATTSNFFAVF